MSIKCYVSTQPNYLFDFTLFPHRTIFDSAEGASLVFLRGFKMSPFIIKFFIFNEVTFYN